MVNISVVIALFNDDGFVAVPMITVADDIAVAVPVTISAALTNRYASTANTNNRYASTANTNAHLFRSSRYCATNSSYSGDHYGILYHCVLLLLLNSGRAMPRRQYRSGFRSKPDENKPAWDGARMFYVRLSHRADGLVEPLPRSFEN